MIQELHNIHLQIAASIHIHMLRKFVPTPNLQIALFQCCPFIKAAGGGRGGEERRRRRFVRGERESDASVTELLERAYFPSM